MTTGNDRIHQRITLARLIDYVQSMFHRISGTRNERWEECGDTVVHQ